MTVRELLAELERENPDDELEVWVMSEGLGYEVGELCAGEPGKVEIQTGRALWTGAY